MNLCSTCGRDFGSLRAFDLHRIGPHATSRRCLSERELRERGYAPNRYGRWTILSEANREAPEAAFRCGGCRKSASDPGSGL